MILENYLFKFDLNFIENVKFKYNKVNSSNICGNIVNILL